MKHLFIAVLSAVLTPLATAQQLIPSNLPSCAQQCTVLQQGQTGCTPAGGAPVSNDGVYQSCFCQSALLTQLYSGTAVQLCSTCSTADMATIQNWYKNYCGKGGAPIANNAQQQPTTSSTSTVSTTGPTSTPSSAATTSNSQGVTSSDSNGPWFSTHWKWVVMLIVMALGLTALAIGGWFLHRRYHRRRESQWASMSSSQPNINTWGPGQSVHDLSFGAGAASNNYNEKGKTRDQARMAPSPLRAQMSQTEMSGGRF